MYGKITIIANAKINSMSISMHRQLVTFLDENTYRYQTLDLDNIHPEKVPKL